MESGCSKAFIVIACLILSISTGIARIVLFVLVRSHILLTVLLVKLNAMACVTQYPNYTLPICISPSCRHSCSPCSHFHLNPSHLFSSHLFASLLTSFSSFFYFPPPPLSLPLQVLLLPLSTTKVRKRLRRYPPRLQILE